jgi:RNA polymerase sigma-70 factor (ECF subfamily)
VISDVVADAARDAYPRIVAALIRVTGDWALAEDCAQEALAGALEKWPRDGVPGNPGGWLMTVARNRAIDVMRRASVENRKLREVAMLGAAEPAADRLSLIFTCCHPALSLEARVALTLRIVAGVPTPSIARLFLVTPETMTRRISRAKAKIMQARIPYRVPTGEALTERLPGVLSVLYLLFTRGYDPDGEPAFADEAIRLARMLRELMPSSLEVSALLALFLLQHSRRAARRDPAGDLVTLERQDRSLWDATAITEGRRLLSRTPFSGGFYELQARIAEHHAIALTFDDTDWVAIAGLYDSLLLLAGTAVVALNRAVAYGAAFGPAVGLRALADAVAGGELDGQAAPVAVEADLRGRLGESARARSLFRKAASMSDSEVEKRALLARAACC